MLTLSCLKEPQLPSQYLSSEEAMYRILLFSKGNPSEGLQKEIGKIVDENKNINEYGWFSPTSQGYKEFEKYLNSTLGKEETLLRLKEVQIVVVDTEGIRLITNEIEELIQFFKPYQIIVLTHPPKGKWDDEPLFKTGKVSTLHYPTINERIIEIFDFKQDPTFILTDTKGYLNYEKMNIVLRTNDFEELREYIEKD